MQLAENKMSDKAKSSKKSLENDTKKSTKDKTAQKSKRKSKDDLELMDIVAKRLGTIMEDNNLTQKELAEKCFFSPDVISKAITKRNLLSVKHAKMIANNMHVSLDYIYGESNVSSMEQESINLTETQLAPHKINIHIGDNVYSLMAINFSNCLEEYFEIICALQDTKFDKDLCEKQLERKRKALLKSLQDKDSTFNEYIILPKDLICTDTILSKLPSDTDNLK